MILPIEDLKHVLSLTTSIWNEFRGKRIFISGGTGFVGSWLVESFLYANKELSLGAEMVILSRAPSSYLSKNPHLKTEPSLIFIQGDICNFEDPEGDFEFVIHAAAEPVAANDPKKALEILEVSFAGTKRVLEFCKTKKVKKYLFVSSGAVYGKQPQDVSHMDESFSGVIDPAASTSGYGEGKRVGELLSCQYGQAYDFNVSVARCFAFVGPKLALNGGYAIGNFIRDALASEDITIKGHGLGKRSYMYASDLAVWLWHILIFGKKSAAYNVGSENAWTMKEWADRIVSLENPRLKVSIQGTSTLNLSGDLYIPSTQKAQKELGLKMTVSENEALLKTLKFYKKSAEAP